MSILRPKFITSTFSSKKKKRKKKGEKTSIHIEGLQKTNGGDEDEDVIAGEIGSDDFDKNIKQGEEGEALAEVKKYEVLGDDPSTRFDWWPDLSDLDRLNIQIGRASCRERV